MNEPLHPLQSVSVASIVESPLEKAKSLGIPGAAELIKSQNTIGLVASLMTIFSTKSHIKKGLKLALLGGAGFLTYKIYANRKAFFTVVPKEVIQKATSVLPEEIQKPVSSSVIGVRG